MLDSSQDTISDDEASSPVKDKDIDGESLASEELDGAPMEDGVADVDGQPMMEDVDGVPLNDSASAGK